MARWPSPASGHGTGARDHPRALGIRAGRSRPGQDGRDRRRRRGDGRGASRGPSALSLPARRTTSSTTARIGCRGTATGSSSSPSMPTAACCCGASTIRSAAGSSSARPSSARRRRRRRVDAPYPFANAVEMLAMAEASGLSIAGMKRANEEAADRTARRSMPGSTASGTRWMAASSAGSRPRASCRAGSR